MTTEDHQKSPLTPEQILQLQADLADTIRDNISVARQVLAGTHTWNATQVKLFGNLLNKVVPDLHHSFIEKKDNRKLSEYTREELEAIAFGSAGAIEHHTDPAATTSDLSLPSIKQTRRQLSHLK